MRFLNYSIRKEIMTMYEFQKIVKINVLNYSFCVMQILIQSDIQNIVCK